MKLLNRPSSVRYGVGGKDALKAAETQRSDKFAPAGGAAFRRTMPSLQPAGHSTATTALQLHDRSGKPAVQCRRDSAPNRLRRATEGIGIEVGVSLRR
jgi:hypothetical protein